MCNVCHVSEKGSSFAIFHENAITKLPFIEVKTEDLQWAIGGVRLFSKDSSFDNKEKFESGFYVVVTKEAEEWYVYDYD